MQTEEQKIQELLKPRYLVIADYPGSEFTINQIIVPQLQNERHEFGSGLILMLSAYPHLFRKLEWWEEQKPEGMPKYVKHKKDERGAVYKARFDHESTSKYWMYLEDTVAHPWNPTDFIPATSAEYTAYISSPELK